jgi:hypothetical protein
MTEEKKDEVYGGLVREYREIIRDIAACSSELKRIGENFKGLGTDLIDRPGALALDKGSFDADVAAMPTLLMQYSELIVKRADKQSELEKFGPLPRFDSSTW